MWREILFLLVVFLSNIVQCITGFAGTVLAMPFATMLMGFSVAKPALNALAIFSSAGVLITNYKSIDRREFLKIIVVMLLGIGGSFFIKDIFVSNAALLYKVLGIIVILFAVMNFVKFFSKNGEKELSPLLAYPLLALSGIIHGIFVCGGPLLVTYASAKIKDTEKFRATLSAVWVVLNSIILVSDIKSGAFESSTVLLTALSVAILIAALFIGNYLCKKMSKKAFLILTYVLMLISGASLLFK